MNRKEREEQFDREKVDIEIDTILSYVDEYIEAFFNNMQNVTIDNTVKLGKARIALVYHLRELLGGTRM